MSMATRTETQSPALHVGDSHDLIRVQGARCPSLFTLVRGREILRTSHVRSSKKATWCRSYAPTVG
jgi:hypothetical protein